MNSLSLPIVRALRASIVAISAAYVLIYVVLVVLRFGYPFELEWLEGTAVDHVRRILAGEGIYSKPSLEFVPLTYTPGYFYLAAAVSKLAGVGFMPLRLISVAASFVVLWLLCRLAWRETGEWQAGVLAAGLFAAMFGWTDGWFDIARNDSLFLALVMSAIYLLRWRTGARAAALAGLLVAFAFLVKQTGLIVAVPLACWCALRGWRPGLAFAAAAAAVIAGTTAYFDFLAEGWYVYYVFKVPAQHPLAWDALLGFWRYDLLPLVGVALIVSLGFVGLHLRRGDRSMAAFYFFAAAGLFGGAWVSRLHSLSHVNVVLPAYAATAVVFAIAVYRARAAGGPGHTVLCLAALAQLSLVAYVPQNLVPTATDRANGTALLRHIAEAPGRVFVPFHGYLGTLAGREPNAHAVTLADVIRGGRTQVEAELQQELAAALRSGEFVRVISGDSTVGSWLPIESFYLRGPAVFSRRSRFWRQEYVYLLKDP